MFTFLVSCGDDGHYLAGFRGGGGGGGRSKITRVWKESSIFEVCSEDLRQQMDVTWLLSTLCGHYPICSCLLACLSEATEKKCGLVGVPCLAGVWPALEGPSAPCGLCSQHGLWSGKHSVSH